MGRPKKHETSEAAPEAAPQEAPLPPRNQLPALLAKAKAEGDEALIARILAACS